MSSVESLIDKATNKNNISEDWSTIMEICDEANANARQTVNYLKKKIVDNNSNVVLYALTLADALVKNCNITVHREISSSYCSEVYNKLRVQNYSFEEPRKDNRKNDEEIKNARLKEDEDLQLASKKKNDSSSSISSPVPQQSSQQIKPLFKVKALYDFLGNYAEGELPLYCGDIINVYDTTYKDWWKGENRGMVGIFPNNYVEKIQESSFSHPVDDEYETQVLRDAQKIDEFMQILSRVDPKTENLSENDELQNMYNSICTLRPKLVKLVEYYSKKMEETSLLSVKFLQAQETYRNLYEQQQQTLYAPVQQPYAPYGQPPQPPQQYIPQQPPTNYAMPVPNSQPPEMMPPQTTIPTTPPGKVAYDPRIVQTQPPQPQPQQPLYMPPYVQGAPVDPNLGYQMPVQSSIPPQMPNQPYPPTQ
ncbi:hypothetical protein PIROE2DRAFT_58943 [Piromyces sp. E2]|nr:hypothetical protein PIROE2DRAFT_58943 [Piromyces sp. E2]|eukprot:OUM67114.1 hypothetical protein PIROE2DRAFT_58943 [Piromyces sp. E2]